eukprot:TRINITY_DN13053_c0_g1_i1.p1 TRINITY_DN13053_c0_g1~~TRINITY_DN13053_c0_g1_i1.p1  ORF type:complete len:1157 (+),score=280.20 TRINITY_DN13053_c0_g1_i1:423-3893(+)
MQNADDVCNGRAQGFQVDCEMCDCLPCSHGGTVKKETGKNACLCECPPAFPAIAGGDCGECFRDNSYCNDHGTIDPADCQTCACEKCANGGTNDDQCSCSCKWPFAPNDVSTDCTACAEDEGEYCNGRGTLNDDCVSCTCAKCTHGTPNDMCECECTGNWQKDDTGDCTTCLKNSVNTCNSRGQYDRVTCGDQCETCLECNHNGENDEFCECDCPFPWGQGDDKDCSVCLKDSSSCSGRGEVGADCETCICATPCSNGGVLQADCSCTCELSAFQVGDDNDCSVCEKGSSYCNDRGMPSQNDCHTCECDACTEGYNDPYCSCICPTPWGQEKKTLDCTVCTDDGHETCNGEKINKDCATCKCSNKCEEDEHRWPNCACQSCPFPFYTDFDGDCTRCSRTDETFCHGRGTVVECNDCDCNVPCKNGGVQDPARCTCDCASSAFNANPYDGDCTVCSITQCPGNGVLNPTTCECECQDCTNGQVDQDSCSCVCDNPWSVDSSTGECVSCLLSGAIHCNNRGVVSQEDCDTCECSDTVCANGGAQADDCSCECKGFWEVDDDTQDCTRCSLKASLFCQNGGFIDGACTGCVCPDCAFGTAGADCTCSCDEFHTHDSDGLCNACSRSSDEVCQRGGALDPSTCRDCLCIECGSNAVEVHKHATRYDCACECTAPFAMNEDSGFCTNCADDCLCKRGGVRDPKQECDVCICPVCANGATTNADCSCQCPAAYGKNARGECTRCLLDDDTFCNGRGFVTPTCDGCICTTCSNGRNTDDCICKCDDPWKKDKKTGLCTKCPITCDDEGETLDLTTCTCLTCTTDCDDRDECTNDTCIAATCVHDLLPECAQCLNITNCGDCEKKSQCDWTNCDDPGLVFGNGSIIRLSDLATEAVGVARARFRAEECDDAKKNNDEDGAFKYCDGLRLEVCVDEIKKDDIDRIFEVCPLDELCPEAEKTNDQIFFKRFCVPGADGTLTSGQGNGDPNEEESPGDDKKDKDENRSLHDARDADERSDEVREFHRRSVEDKDVQGYEVEIEIDGVVLDVDDIAERIEKDDDRCIPHVLNTTLQCHRVGCSSTDNKITAAGLTIGAAVGGGSSAAGGIAFFGAAWGLAFFRQNKGIPVDMPDCEFDATDAFVNINDDVYMSAGDGMTDGMLFEEFA